MASFSRGTSFTDGVTGDVTAAKLHALVDSATPVAGLVTDRTAKTSVIGTDVVLISDSADSNNLKKVTVTNLANNLPTAVITTGTVTTLNSTTGTITGANITTGTIATLTSSTATISTLSGNTTGGTYSGNIVATAGTVATLNSTTGTITNLNSTSGTVATLNSTTGTIATLTSTAATITTGTIPTLVATTSITSGTGTASAPAICPTGDTDTGVFFPAANQLAISTQSTEAFRVNASGQVLIGKNSATANGGDLQISGGITFPASQSAKSDANTLDDYEEGTFTPRMDGTTLAGTGTYTVQIGRYTKIGQRVMVDIVLSWSAHTGTGNMEVANLPFTISNTVNYNPSATIGRAHNWALGTGRIMVGWGDPGTTNITLHESTTDAASVTTAVVAVDSAATIFISLNYNT